MALFPRIRKRQPDLSIVVAAHDMQRELPRTIFTLSRDYQRDIEGFDYEIIVVDNGSREPVDEAALRQIAPNLRVMRSAGTSPSPAAALNTAMRAATGEMLGLFIDGARMTSPGLIAAARRAWQADSAAVIGFLAFHLGPDVQMRSVSNGYNQNVEDDLLASVDWRNDGYRLFDICALAGSSAGGWFEPISESNGVFLSRSMWDGLGGLDERFASPGGGLVNLDFWERAVRASKGPPWMPLGEGTFHQVHGGAATNGSDEARAAMQAEYFELHGHHFQTPDYRPRLIGELDRGLARFGRPGAPDEQRMVHSVMGRSFRVGLAREALQTIQAGTLATRYKGLKLLKNPFDLALYARLLERLAPQTIIEIGTAQGGAPCGFATSAGHSVCQRASSPSISIHPNSGPKGSIASPATPTVRTRPFRQQCCGQRRIRGS